MQKKKNSEYWKSRFQQVEAASFNQGAEYRDMLETEYMKAQQEIEKQIRSWYQRFADNNEISLEEARKWLTKSELDELKWNVQEYIKYGEDNEVFHMWNKQLENASAKYHVSRLELLKLQTQQSIEVLFGNHLDSVDGLMKDIYSNGYYHSMFEVQKGFNVGWNIASVDDRKLEKLISKPWAADGKNFSERIWGDKNKLINEMHTELTQMCMLGKSPDQAIKNIAKKMNTSKNNAGKLVMTEAAYFSSVSQKDCFNDLDVEKYEIVATLDSHTSAICQEMDGKIFKMNEYDPGTTAPPFHPWCRTVTVPAFEDEFEIGERAARGEDGKTYFVPSNTKYPDWKKFFVDEPDGLNIPKFGSTMKVKDEWDGLEYTSSYTKDQAISHLSSEYGIKFKDSKKYPIDDGILNDCVGWMDSFKNQYGAFIDKNPCHIPVIANHAPSKMKNAVGYYSYYSNGNVVELALNGAYHSDPSFFQSYLDKVTTKEKNWSVQNATLKHTFVHEFGHHVSNSLRHLTSNPSWQHDFVAECIKEFKEIEPNYTYNTYVGMADYVSRYGATSESELFAEAFAEYFGGENPRAFAKLFGKKLDEILKGVK